MIQENNKLGRGLSALLSSKSEKFNEFKGFKTVNITMLQANKNQIIKKSKASLMKKNL